MSEPAPGGEAWDKVATILRRAVPRQQFETWFRGMRLVSLYQDLHAPAGAGQWFCIFEPRRS